MEQKYVAVDELTIELRCLHCGNDRFDKPIYVIADLEHHSHVEFGCLKCFKDTFVGIFWDKGKAVFGLRETRV